jgi:glucokinase
MREVVAAVDVGGTRVKAALVDRSYDVVAALTVPTPAEVAADIGGTVASAVAELLATAAARGTGPDTGPHARPHAGPVRVVGCGVVVPGLVDERRGVGLWSANLGWRDLPVGAPVSARLQVPTAVGHDVRAGLLAETRLGAARGARHALFLPVGTGIAGALMLEGMLVSADGWAGELGHMVVDPAGLPCACGAVGCLETVGSAAAVERAYAATTGRRCSAEQVAALTAAGNPAATQVWGRAVSALGAAVAATVTLTGVDLVLLGGGLAESGETLLRPLRADLDARLTFQRRPRLEKAALGDRAGCLGAACLAWDAL